MPLYHLTSWRYINFILILFLSYLTCNQIPGEWPTSTNQRPSDVHVTVALATQSAAAVRSLTICQTTKDVKKRFEIKIFKKTLKTLKKRDKNRKTFVNVEQKTLKVMFTVWSYAFLILNFHQTSSDPKYLQTLFATKIDIG